MAKSRNRKKRNHKRSGHGERQLGAFLIRQTAQFPIRECRINDDWGEKRMATIHFARNRSDGRVAIAAFNVDLGCLGIKSAFAHPAISVAEYESGLLPGQAAGHVRCDPAFAVKLIQGAYEYARQLGFEPDPDYHYARQIFGDIDPTSCPFTIAYGVGGKPFYVAGPYDNVERILNQLSRRVGPDGFHFIAPFGPAEVFDLFEDGDDRREWRHV